MSINSIAIVYAGIIGVIVGSALNAVVWRLYVGRKWTRGRSMCPECKHELAARDLIPVVSWLWLKGKCRYCRKRIHWQYPLVELMTGLLFALSTLVLGFDGVDAIIRLVLWLAVLTLLIVLAIYDARWMVLPNKIMYPALILGGIYLAASAILAGSLNVLWGGLAAAVFAGGSFYGLVTATKGRAMGGGDIKLAALIGLLLGLQATVVALFVAYNIAAIYGLAVGIRKKAIRGTYVPFGPFLILGLITAFLFGRDIVAWYLRLNGLA